MGDLASVGIDHDENGMSVCLDLPTQLRFTFRERRQISIEIKIKVYSSVEGKRPKGENLRIDNGSSVLFVIARDEEVFVAPKFLRTPTHFLLKVWVLLEDIPASDELPIYAHIAVVPKHQRARRHENGVHLHLSEEHIDVEASVGRVVRGWGWRAAASLV